jgi:hypothetical protein
MWSKTQKSFRRLYIKRIKKHARGRLILFKYLPTSDFNAKYQLLPRARHLEVRLATVNFWEDMFEALVVSPIFILAFLVLVGSPFIIALWLHLNLSWNWILYILLYELAAFLVYHVVLVFPTLLLSAYSLAQWMWLVSVLFVYATSFYSLIPVIETNPLNILATFTASIILGQAVIIIALIINGIFVVLGRITRNVFYPEAVLVDGLLEILFMVQTKSEKWTDLSFKRKIMNKLEEVASCITGLQERSQTEMSEQIGILKALWRMITFYRWRKAASIARAANKQFTSSVTGITDAFDLEMNQKVQEYKQLESAIAEVENVIEDKRLQLERLNGEEKELFKKREGALALAEKAQLEGNNDAFAQHQAAFARFQSRITEIEERQKSLSEQIKQYEESMKKYMLQLTKMQAYVQSLPAQKAEAIADFVSAQRIIELNHRLMGIKTSFEAGPVSLVLEENRKLTAQARVSEKMAGTDVELQDTMYAEAGRSSESGDLFAKMLAARKAQKEAQPAPSEKVKIEETGGKGNDRPNI